MWAAIDDDVHSDVRKTLDASRRQRYIKQENRVPFMKNYHAHSSSNGNRNAEDDVQVQQTDKFVIFDLETTGFGKYLFSVSP